VGAADLRGRAPKISSHRIIGGSPNVRIEVPPDLRHGKAEDRIRPAAV